MLNLLSLWAVLTAAQVPPDPACEAVQSQYVQGFEALVHGDDAVALAVLDEVVRACPTHPFAPELARLARTRLAQAPAAQPEPLAEEGTPVDLRHESPSRLARAELVAVQTLHGATQGLLLCAQADCSEGRAIIGSALLGSAAGLGVSLIVFPDGVRPGQALAINSGTVWGAVYGALLNGAIPGTNDDALQRGRIMLGMAGFTGAGALAANLWQPSAGQVSMVNSGGLWTGVLAGLLTALADTGTNADFYRVELAAVSAGMVGLGFVASRVPVSRGRMLIIDAGGILGGLTGAAAVYFADQDPGDGLPLGAALGVATGLGVTAYLTRNFDAPELPGGVALLPQLGRGTGGLTLVGQF